MRREMSDNISKRLPVFVFPSSLTFHLDEPSTHKQVLTLYNPYDFVVQFKVMSTAPWKYQVVDPEGSIKPHCCVDLVVRHNSLTVSNIHTTDKFRIQMSEMLTKQTVGKKDVAAILLPGKSPATQEFSTSQDVDHFQQFPGHSSSLQSADTTSRLVSSVSRAGETYTVLRCNTLSYTVSPTDNRTTNVLAILIGAVCVLALLLPQDDLGSNITATFPFVKLSSHQKLVFAYTLGLVTMVILRV